MWRGRHTGSLTANPASLAELIVGRHRFLLTGHEHPDGDCLGSEVGLYHLLSGMGKEVVIANPDPVRRDLDFLLEHTPIGVVDDLETLDDIDVVVLLDCARLDRLGESADRIAGSGATVAVIDHHVGSERADGEVCFVDSEAPATGLLVHRLYEHFGVELTPAAAEGIFVSLVSDTGWFRYSNTSAEVLDLAARLCKAGVEPSKVFDKINRRNAAESVELLATGISRSRIELDGRLGVLAVDYPLMKRAGAVGVDLDLWMEPLRSVEGIEVVTMLKELMVGTVKVSLRAQGDIDVQAIARQFGGGGHRKAAGATVRAPLAEVEQRVVEAVGLALREAGAGG